jgi:hypothetical protein
LTKSIFALVKLKRKRYIEIRGDRMAAAKVKPVQATEIKNKKIAREVIAQIRRPIPASVYRKQKKKAEYIDKFFQ